MAYPVAAVKQWEEWGPAFVNAATQARHEWLQAEGLHAHQGLKGTKILLGSDCSGCEAPVFALHGLRLPFRHRWSCDVAKHSRRWIQEVCKRDKFFGDMLQRQNVQELPSINLYTCGLPCKPYSSLHWQSSGFKDPNARPFEAS